MMTGAQLGRAVRWPLWSWRNLTVTAVVLLALLAGVGRLTDTISPAAARSASPAPRAGSAMVPPMNPSTTTPASPQTSSPPPPATPSAAPSANHGSPVEVATAFVTAWAATSRTEPQWLAGMRPWASAELVSSMTGTDPTQVPATRVTGDAALRATTTSTATVSVPTDGGRIAVKLVKQVGSWKATTVAPDDAPPGAPTPSLGPSPTGSSVSTGG